MRILDGVSIQNPQGLVFLFDHACSTKAKRFFSRCFAITTLRFVRGKIEESPGSDHESLNGIQKDYKRISMRIPKGSYTTFYGWFSNEFYESLKGFYSDRYNESVRILKGNLHIFYDNSMRILPGIQKGCERVSITTKLENYKDSTCMLLGTLSNAQRDSVRHSAGIRQGRFKDPITNMKIPFVFPLVF